MTVTALRFHWILTRDEVRSLVGATSEADDARNLWGYVDLQDAARACLLALTARADGASFEALLIAAGDTRVTRPIGELLAEYCPDSELRAPRVGTAGAFDCSRARRLIAWTPQSRWRDPS